MSALQQGLREQTRDSTFHQMAWPAPEGLEVWPGIRQKDCESLAWHAPEGLEAMVGHNPKEVVVGHNPKEVVVGHNPEIQH